MYKRKRSIENYQIQEFHLLKSILKAVQIFPSRALMFCSKRCKLKCKILDQFHPTIFICGSAKKLDEKKNKEDKQAETELNSAQRRSQFMQNPSQYKPFTLNEFSCSCLPCDKHLSELIRSVWGIWLVFVGDLTRATYCQ